MDILSQVIIASLGVSFISLVGGLLLIWNKLSVKKFSTYLVAFAAGVMLTTAFIDLLPEALEYPVNENIYFYGLFGIIVFFLIERVVIWFHHHDKIRVKPTAYLVLLGDGLHNFFDGLAIAAAFIGNPGLGLVTTLAISAHEIPHEIADLSILIYSGMKTPKALFYNFVSALTALIGAVIGFYYLNKFEKMLPALLMFSAGVFIYIACTDLIPDLHQDFKKEKKWSTTITFILGVILTYFLITSLEH
ncbi:hypothetical protein A2954_00965 [Candidatus Roizmanbacteria bacterium RIFCSPLOWO2_01_FULL_37_12]|uniref:ZIP zinc transporter n=1 Tax=Candidatus Roizmanbacteria bacterium RIFCSPLOWO2_01_FULL_37_12 TaxID=1802056 RepID=A0A1F7IGL0_9BACT|nr:MAG: hypothetical protein A3D76_00190 [Candidatus Roizmanbacteria bacterium RIFCSPHIGHO2_02_FULL_37_9b]OGK42491.1 MAG: hypothetical protein A2954_00965 [Candidatus Roizmanbacteria bacterium RIFCSPLOWO2_01_FULL_37_12]